MDGDNAHFNGLAYTLNTIWISMFVIGFSLYSLWVYLGSSCMSGLMVLLLTLPLNSIITRRVKYHQEEAMKFRDLRVKVTAEVIDGIKVIKFNAWEKAFADKIGRIREQENKHLRAVTYFRGTQSFFLRAAPVFSATATFATYVWMDDANILTAEKAFVSISYFNIIRHPMEWMPNFFNQITHTYISVGRLNSFLGAKEVHDSDIDLPAHQNVAIELHDAHFSWGNSNDTGINIDKLTVKRGEIIGVIGRVGSGKSSLLSCLLNDMEKIRGWIAIHESKAYLPPQPFIRNASLRDNILFGEAFNKNWYQTVIRACGLVPDLKLLKNSDLTEIGEKGVNLSGGQRQRVGLARVIYSKKEIYLLDDPLSAVDVHVAKHIFDQCFDGESGLLAGKTVVFITNSSQYLPRMDRVVIMEEGTVKTIGPYKLIEQHASFLRHGSISENLNLQSTLEASETLNESSHSITGIISTQGNIETSKLVSEEKIETHTVSKQVYAFYLKEIGLWTATAAFLMHFLSQSLMMCTNWWLVEWTSNEDNFNRDKGMTNYLTVYSVLGTMSLFAVIGATVSVLSGGLSASTAIHRLVLDRVLGTHIDFFESNPRGRIINRFASDVGYTDSDLPHNYNMAIGALFQLACIVTVICFANPYFFIVITPVVLIIAFLQPVLVKASR